MPTSEKVTFLTAKYDSDDSAQSINDSLIPSEIKDEIHNLEFKEYNSKIIGKVEQKIDERTQKIRYFYIRNEKSNEIKSLKNIYTNNIFLLSDNTLTALAYDKNDIGNLEKYRFMIIDISKDEIVNEKEISG